MRICNGCFEGNQDLLAFVAAAHRMPIHIVDHNYHLLLWHHSRPAKQDDTPVDRDFRREYFGDVRVIHFLHPKPWFVSEAVTSAHAHFINSWREFVEHATGASVKQFLGDLPVLENDGHNMFTAAETPSVTKLPLLPASPFGPDKWDLLEGVSAEVVQGSAVVSGQRIMRLVAVGVAGRHALGIRFSGLAPGGVYRAAAWVKAVPHVRVMLEARDSIDPHPGKPSNFGSAHFDPAAHWSSNFAGEILASGMEATGDEWIKLWIDQRSADGRMYVTISLLEGPSMRHVFKAAGQEITFGGFEISPLRPGIASTGLP
jgi:hypothetical protein